MPIVQSISDPAHIHMSVDMLTSETEQRYRTNTGAGKGILIYTFKMLKPVLLFPRWCKGDAGALLRGLEGRPIPVKTFRGGAGAGVVIVLSSSGVGGN